MGNWFVQMGKNAEASGQGGANATSQQYAQRYGTSGSHF